MKVFILFVFLSAYCFAEKGTKHKPEQGIFNQTLTEQAHAATVFKTLFENTSITISYQADVKPVLKSKTSSKADLESFLNITVIGTNCKGLFSNDEFDRKILNGTKNCLKEHEAWILHEPHIEIGNNELDNVSFSNEWSCLMCDQSGNISAKTLNSNTFCSRSQTIKRQISSASKLHFVDVPRMGEYVVVVEAVFKQKFSINLLIDMKHSNGYLSADEYPLLIFYLIMCVVYIIYFLIWLVLSLCNCRDLLRVQYWIWGVILLGLIEKIVHFAEYDQVNKTGLSNNEMEKFAEVIACFKRTVSRMLVIVVSLGFGIVKPRLGQKLYQVLGVGFVYFIVALLLKVLEKDVYYSSSSREGWLLMFMPLLFIDMFILYWVLRSLMQTLKTLRLRRNVAKLSLYRHFTNIIVLCALVSLGMSIYILYYHELGCSENFANNWFETACWPLLFSLILLVIMVLWRPSGNNKRYAYSPLIDGNESENDESEEPMLGNGVTESMKSRAGKKTENIEMDINMTDENLKWIDENIPPTVADAALPVLMDAADVKKATKYEMSKMD